ncbi:MAG: PaaI family thioesterase [Synergistaceae bacterium]
MNYKEKALELFSKDNYACKVTGAEIVDVDLHYAKCSLVINESHLNAAGVVMGGAIFTLADFAFAVATTTENPFTVSLSASIDYINGTVGPILYAETKCIKNGRTICFYEIQITDSNGKNIALATITGFKKTK